MGCSHSVPLREDSLQHRRSLSQQREKKEQQQPVPTRKRTDSWANYPANFVPGSALDSTNTALGIHSTSAAAPQPINGSKNGPTASKTLTNSSASPTRSKKHHATTTAQPTTRNQLLKAQWQYIWDHHGPPVDPADVPAVLEMLQNAALNRLGAVRMTWLLRKVRCVLQTLPNTKGNKLSINNTSSPHEARVLAKHKHLLTRECVELVLHGSSSSDGGSSSSEWQTLVPDNLWCLLQHLSNSPERITAAAQLCPINLDVNHALQEPAAVNKDKDTTTTTSNSNTATTTSVSNNPAQTTTTAGIPRPSSVPDFVQAATLPTTGVSFSSVATLVALGVAGTRAQKLQLLFYLCHAELHDFLAYHPAGGTPLWLLETKQGLSLASLTHYHYYGTAFLPGDDANNNNNEDDKDTRPAFVASSSRKPVTISARTLYSLVLDLLSPRSKAAEPNGNRSNGHNSQHSTDSEQSTTTPTCPASLSERIQSTDEWARVSDTQDSSNLKELVESHPLPTIEQQWTLQEYKEWADEYLGDIGLQTVLHRLFGAGIFSTHVMEKEVVQQTWETWRQKQVPANKDAEKLLQPSVLRGGLGGVDDKGGAGHGVLYCLDKKWWDEWVAYTGWSWFGERPNPRSRLERPGAISNHVLLATHEEASIVDYGSYHVMSKSLEMNKDYVLVPPGVWNVLHELYGGGPPLPRMVKDSHEHSKYFANNQLSSSVSSHNNTNHSQTEDVEVDLDEFVQQIDTTAMNGRVPCLPQTLHVIVHPWILHCQLCDPTQPYRRGDAGLTSIRLQVTPDQPLHRVFSECVARFPLWMQAYKSSAATAEGQESGSTGQARLWKQVGITSRHGPWNLLCKSRFAKIPLQLPADNPEQWLEDWKEYTDDATVESIGLIHDDRLLFEFGVQNAEGDLKWPREAAAKEGRVRRLAEEESEFRRLLQGVDEEGNMMLQPPKLIGMDIDAMDGAGRWYAVKILQVELVDLDDTEGEDQSDGSHAGKGSSKRIQVDFTDHGGHLDWIDAESDRLGPRGRFTNEAEKSPAKPAVTSPGDAKTKPVALVKRNSNGNGDECTKLCTFPGYGACGLTNLGNTCYMNSALQCISFLPLLRAYLLSYQYKATGDLNKDNPLGTGGKFLEESAELLRIMWSARMGEKSPTRFKTQLGKINERFFGADQQDAQEFLSYMLDILHEDSNRVRKKPYVEALEDDWVKRTSLPRVGEEAWRRFLRRNRSIMADVAHGQVLNTVTCPVCNYSSRNFDPFNLLSLPIPTVADVIFQCIVYRRASPLNNSWILNRPRRGSSRSQRFTRKSSSSSKHTNGASGPPSDTFVAEQYVVSMSRLADSGDLRLQIQNLSGIAANQLRLCRAEEVPNEDFEDKKLLSHVNKLTPLNDKEGPCSQLAKKRLPGDDSPVSPTVIIAFENTLRLRVVKDKANRSGDETAPDDAESTGAAEQAEASRCMETYGDEKECRLIDSDPIVLSKSISRKMWPKDEAGLQVGLRVDAKDHRGNWYAGSVVNVFEEVANGGDADTGEEIEIRTKKVTIHYDNFTSKWDETASIEQFEEGKVQPLYTHASPRPRPLEFLVYNRHTDSKSGESIFFGQPFFIHCYSEWTNARASAHIFAQASRFMQYIPGGDDTTGSPGRSARSQRVYEKTCAVVSDLIDILVDFDREYTRSLLGVADESGGDSSASNGSIEPSKIATALSKKALDYMARLPFEIRRGSKDPFFAEKAQVALEEELFPLSLVRTVGNYMNAQNVLILQWRDPPREKGGTLPSSIRAPVMYVDPIIQIHKNSAGILKQAEADDKNEENRKKKARPGSAGMDIGVCLTEYCKAQKLSLSSDNWRCPRCKDFREGNQDMHLWRLPDLLTFHIKRFNMSARWREKITTRVNFPLSGLDLSEWCHEESPVIRESSADSNVYDLIGVMNHYGSMTGGHYVATCRATPCGREGKEEVAYMFNEYGVNKVETEESETSTGWRLGRTKTEVNQNKVSAAMSAKAASESAEPLWLQFDDELVEPIPPDHVVSDMAYVLFYRRRQITPSNIARYSTLE